MRREPCEVTETASCDAHGVARRRAATRGRPRSDGRAFSRRPTARAVRRNVIGKGHVAYLQDRARCARVARRHRRERLQRRRLLGRTRHLGRVARWGSACPQPRRDLRRTRSRRRGHKLDAQPETLKVSLLSQKAPDLLASSVREARGAREAERTPPRGPRRSGRKALYERGTRIATVAPWAMMSGPSSRRAPGGR